MPFPSPHPTSPFGHNLIYLFSFIAIPFKSYAYTFFLHSLYSFTQIVFLSKKSMKTLMKLKNVLHLGRFNYPFLFHTWLVVSAVFDAVGCIVLQRPHTLLFLSQAHCPVSPSFLFQPLMLLCSEIHSLASFLYLYSLRDLI